MLAILLGAPALRLLVLATQSRRAPELLAGLFFAGAGVGIPLRILGAARAASEPAAAWWLNGCGHVLFAGGACALYAFVTLVFRPESRSARLACGGGIVAVLATTAAVFATDSVNAEQAGAVLLTNLSRLGALAWAFAESFRYWRMMRRRVALGLGDPVVANRFGLWSVWTGALTLVPLLAAASRIAGRVLLATQGDSDGASLIETYLGVVMNAIRAMLALAVPFALFGLWMSFFPPERYLARVRDRAVGHAPG